MKRATGSANCKSLAAARWTKVGLALCVALTGVPVAPAYGDELATTFEEDVRDASVPQEVEAAVEDDVPSGENPAEVVDRNTDMVEGDEEPAQQAVSQETFAEEAAAIESVEALSDAVAIAEDAGEPAEQPLEGPENSWRYENGVRIIPGLSSEIATFGAEPGYDTYVTWTKANGSKSYTYRANPTDKSEIVSVPNTTGVGIDVSVHQGKIDWAKVKADGINFAIIRLGYGSDYTSQDDTYFLDNVKGAKANGIPFGVYLYSYATKATGAAPSAASEADHALRQLKAAGLGPNDLAMPVFYDLEDKTQASLSTSELASLAKAFCDKITAAGYKAGIYANQNWWTTKLTDPTFARSGWSKWVAQYFQSKQTAPKNISDQQYWQFTDCGKVNGINGYVDVNFSYAPPVAPLEGPAKTWAWVGGKAYYYGEDGHAVRWGQWIEGKFYYFNEKYQMVSGWLTWNADGLKSYFKVDPKTGLAPALMGWQQIGGKWYYFNPSTGKYFTWSHWINGNFFYFNGSGVMQEGWVTWNADSSKSYFAAGTGRAKFGWQQIGGKWYYFNPATGKTLRWGQKINGNFFYFNSQSEMVEGWVIWNADATKSYFNYGSGRAKLGWQQIGGKWYYFNPATGKSLRWGQKIDGNFFYFDSASVMQEGWITWNADATKSYFNYGSGRAKLGWQQIGGKWYYFNPATGKTLRWGQKINGNFFYFNSQSEMVEGWVTWNADGRKSYFAKGTGRALLGWQTLGGKRYYFDPDTGKSLVGTHIIDGEKYIFADDSTLIGGDSVTKSEPTGASFSKMAQAERDSYIKDAGKDCDISTIETAMKPATYPAGTKQFYQFAQLNNGYSGLLSAEQLNSYISSTANGRAGMLAGMGSAFVDAARLYRVNEAYLLAHAIVESGWGTSTLAKGYAYDGVTQVSGKTWPKGTYYNFYGIGAYDSSPLSGGRALAIKNGWNTREKAILGAAQWISTNYLNNSYGQDTLYKMRWNYTQYSRYGSVGHQYATDPQWAATIASVMSDIYSSAGIVQQKANLTFLVPTYK